LNALDLFRTSVIAKMLPIGRILSQALRPHLPPRRSAP
jgi:hypothetical protein